jgi:hypothetical protein
MTRSDRQEKPDVPESTVRELHALYREAARDEPGPLLDRGVLDAARAELESAVAAKARPAPWWKGWLPAATALAAVVVGVSLTWRVMDEQERRLREEMQALPAAPEVKRKSAADTVAAPAPAAGSGAAPATVNAPVATEREEAVAAQPPAALEPRAVTVPATPAAVMPQEVDAKKAARSEVRETESRRDAVVQDAAPALSRTAPKLEAGRLGAGNEAAGAISSAPAAKALAAPETVSPEVWLQRIRELRAAGREAEAAQSLARFRQRYPDFPLPADLR